MTKVAKYGRKVRAMKKEGTCEANKRPYAHVQMLNIIS